MSINDGPAGKTGGQSGVSAADLPERLRVHALAKLVGRTGKQVLSALGDLGQDVRSVQSNITRATAEQVIAALGGTPDGSAPVRQEPGAAAVPPARQEPGDESAADLRSPVADEAPATVSFDTWVVTQDPADALDPAGISEPAGTKAATGSPAVRAPRAPLFAAPMLEERRVGKSVDQV